MIYIKTIIMAGGKGSRLRPLTFIRPKPMIPLLNQPIIEHSIDKLKQFGFKDLILTLNYMPDSIKNYFKNGSDRGLNINYTIEKSPLGTGGSVRYAEKYIDDTFLVLSGDVVSDVNFKKIIKFHKEKDALATLVLTEVDDPTHFGIAVLDQEQHITNFLEKPSKQKVFSSLANTGIYVLEPEIFDFFDKDQDQVDFSNDIFPRLLEEKKDKMYGYVYEGYWSDVGRPETYLKTSYDILNQKIKHKIKESRMKPGTGRLGKIWAPNNINIEKKVKIEGPVVIGNNCTIENGCKLSKGTVIAENVHIGKNTHIKGSIVHSNSFIGGNSILNGCIIDTHCHINKNTIMEKGAITGSKVEIGENSVIKSSRIHNNVKILPNSVITGDYH
jgi:mannose-1-phosphate guanylyltransferase